MDWYKCQCECKLMATFAESLSSLFWLKSQSTRGASRHSAFMGNCLIISHTCYRYLPDDVFFLFLV